MESVLHFFVLPLAVLAFSGFFSCAFIRPKFYLAFYPIVVWAFLGLSIALIFFNFGVTRAVSMYQIFVIDEKVHGALAKDDTDSAEKALIASEEGIAAMHAAAIPWWPIVGFLALGVIAGAFGQIAIWHVREQQSHKPRDQK